MFSEFASGPCIEQTGFLCIDTIGLVNQSKLLCQQFQKVHFWWPGVTWSNFRKNGQLMQKLKVVWANTNTTSMQTQTQVWYTCTSVIYLCLLSTMQCRCLPSVYRPKWWLVIFSWWNYRTATISTNYLLSRSLHCMSAGLIKLDTAW